MTYEGWSPERQVREVAAALMSWADSEREVPIRTTRAFAADLIAAADQMAGNDR